MILCKYSELRRYAAVLPHLDAALECVAKVCAEGLKEGRREFEGGYLSVQTGRTAPLADGCYETHHRYADVQYMVRGEEETAYLSMEDLAPATEYDAEKDIQFFHSVGAQPTVAHVPAECATSSSRRMATCPAAAWAKRRTIRKSSLNFAWIRRRRDHMGEKEPRFVA